MMIPTWAWALILVGLMGLICWVFEWRGRRMLKNEPDESELPCNEALGRACKMHDHVNRILSESSKGKPIAHH